MPNLINKTVGPEAFSARQLPLGALVPPTADEVHLWHLNFNTLTNPLHPGIPAQSDQLSFSQLRAVRRFYLRLLLGSYLNLPGKQIHITRRVKGRPELDPAQSKDKLNFNVARSNDCYLIGISSGAPIGVDLEIAARRSGKPMALARRYFSPGEISRFDTFSGDKLHYAFMYTWACKEAIVKANGKGIANQLCRFSVEVDPQCKPKVLDMMDDEAGAWNLAIAEPANGAIAAVAVRQPGLKLTGFSLS